MFALWVGKELAPFAKLGFIVELTAAQNQMTVEGFAVPIVTVGTVPTPILRLLCLFL